MSPVNDFGFTPSHIAESRWDSSGTLPGLLVDAGADILSTHIDFRTILCTATMYGSHAMGHLLFQRGAIPTTCNGHRDTLPHCEAWSGPATTVRLFLESGLNVQATNKGGETPLHVAARDGRQDYVKEILQCGANVDAIDNEGPTPLKAFLSCGRSTWAAHHILHHETEPDIPTCRAVAFDEPVVDRLFSPRVNIRASRHSTRSLLNWAAALLKM
jgi:ankyrin repeat protein